MRTTVLSLPLAFLVSAAAAQTLTLPRNALERAIPVAAGVRATHTANPWETIVRKVRTQGRFRPADHFPANYGLESVTGNPAASHRAEYVNLWGYQDSLGVFQPGYVTMVSENWPVEADGNWHIDQWIFRFRLDGSVIEASHNQLVETMSRSVLEYKTLETWRPSPGPDAAAAPRAVQAKVDELTRLWAAFGPAARRR